jgi:hypothetical protein
MKKRLPQLPGQAAIVLAVVVLGTPHRACFQASAEKIS